MPGGCGSSASLSISQQGFQGQFCTRGLEGFEIFISMIQRFKDAHTNWYDKNYR